MSTLDMQFVGLPEVRVNDNVVRLRRRASLVLLAYLALSRRPHSRDALATFLSGDAATDAARKRLRNALADLVDQGLGPFLTIDRQFIALNPPVDYALDVDRLDAASDLRTVDDTAIRWAAEHCDLELLAGIGLDDAPDFEDWLTAEREHRREQLISSTTRYLEQCAQTGDYERGITLARKLLAVDSLNEIVHRLLIRLLALDGQSVAALAQFERCRRILSEELGVEPQSATTDLVERLLSGSRATVRHNLPAASESMALVGRDVLLDEIGRQLVDPACRLLSIIGLGGIGKTSLALATGQRQARPTLNLSDHPFADGIFFVDLREARLAPNLSAQDIDQQLLGSIGLALGIAFYGKIDRLTQIVAYLKPKHLLLILDGLEDCATSAHILDNLLSSAPGVTILVTSRMPIAVSGASTIEPDRLTVPTTPDQVLSASASALFVREGDRIGAQLGPDDWPAVVRICALTGGLPLAIKVAASMLRVMTASEIADEIISGATLLDEPSGVGGSRASVRSIVNAAIAELSVIERDALLALSVFPASFTRDAAEAVSASIAVLLALNRRSLIDRNADGRSSLHPLVRRVASEQLAERPEAERQARAAHAAHFAALVERTTPSMFRAADGEAILADELANLRVAWDWSVDSGDIAALDSLLAGLSIWHQRSGRHADWNAALNAATASVRSQDVDRRSRTLLVRLLIETAETLLWQGELDIALSLIDEARELARAADGLRLEAALSLTEGRLLRFRGNQTLAANEALHQARVLARTTAQPHIEARSLLELSYSSIDSEDYRMAQHYLDRAEPVFHQVSDQHALARTTMQHGRIAVAFGDFVRAREELERSLHYAERFADRFVEAFSTLQLGIVYDMAFGRHDDANTQFDHVRTIAQQTGDPHLDGNVHRARGRNEIHVGNFDRAAGCFEVAVDLAMEYGNARALGDSLSGIAQLANATGEYELALDRSQQALRIANETGRQHAAATALLVRGIALERLGDRAAAHDAFNRANVIAESLGIPYLCCEARTGLASVALQSGYGDPAYQYIEPVVAYALQQQYAGCDEPSRTTLICYRVLSTEGDRRAAAILDAGMTLLRRRADDRPPQERQHYLDAFDTRVVVRQLHDELTLGASFSRPISPSVRLLPAESNSATAE